jgi:hypothetical protein
MKTMYFKKAFFLMVLLVSLFFVSVHTQTLSNDGNTCLDIQFEDGCYSSIKNKFPDFVYLKSRPFSYQINPDVNFSVLLKKNFSYVFSICSNFQSKAPTELKLYNDKNELLITQAGDKISFQPERAGKYYITSSLGKNRNNCCIVLCGMLNKYTPLAKSKK